MLLKTLYHGGPQTSIQEGIINTQFTVFCVS